MATKKAAAKKAAPKKAVAQPAPKKVAAPKKSNVVVVDFSDDSKELLRELISAITSSFAPVIAMAPVAQQPAAASPAAQQPASAQPAAVAPNTLLTSIREMINVKAGEGKTAEIVALLGKYGAQSASTLAAEHFEAFFEDLKAI